MTLDIIYIIYAGILGLLVGSFLNVVILRYPAWLMWGWKQEAHEFLEIEMKPEDVRPAGIAKKRSGCPKCGHQLSWWENIPVISYVILLRGKCRGCKQPISMQYPLVELSMGILAAACVYQFGWNYTGLIAASLCAILVTLTGIDFKTQLLPDDIVLPTMWAGILITALTDFWPEVTLTQSVIGAAVGYLSLWTVFWGFKIITKKEGMGYGDFKLLALLGAFFGAGSIITIVLIASVTGGIVGTILKRMNDGESIPFAFGPYLALGGIVYLFFGQQVSSLIM